MPNWCSNRLKVTGPAEELAKFSATMAGGVFYMDQTVPAPKELDEIHSGFYRAPDGSTVTEWREAPDSDGTVQRIPISEQERRSLHMRFGCVSSCDWARIHWGTKWDACQQKPLPDGEVGAWFYTAWAPPVPWLATVSRLFPALGFELAFAEMGAGFYGVATASGGVVAEDLTEGTFFEPRGDDEDECPPLRPGIAEHLQRYGLHKGG